MYVRLISDNTEKLNTNAMADMCNNISAAVISVHTPPLPSPFFLVTLEEVNLC